MGQDVASAIPDRVGNDIYAVYTDFAADHISGYTFLLGARVSSIDHVPADMIAKQVPAGRYTVVTSEKGPLPQVVPAVWVKIWTMTPAQLGGTRTFKADYEVYNFEAMDPQDSQVGIHIGVQ